MRLLLTLLLISLCCFWQQQGSAASFATAWQSAVKNSINRQLRDEQSMTDREELQQIAPFFNADELGYRIKFLNYLQTINPDLWEQMQHKDVLLLELSQSGEIEVMKTVILLQSGNNFQAYYFSGTGSWHFDKKAFWTSKKVNAARYALRCPYAGRNADDVVVTSRINQTGRFVSEYYARNSICSVALAHGDWIDEGW
ncbi:MAG: hypothetical protein JWR44_15 [Hymenobacter sp.]|jgi:hypothetical protein|nr:hypothetical protein [Hymenobacter sp.]